MQVAASLDALKETGFHWATRSGVTVAIEDVITGPGKQAILDRHESDAEKIEKQFQRGVITDDERRQELVEIWTRATAEVAKDMEQNFPPTNPIALMVNAGASGNMMQIRQLAGMRGLVANPKGEIIPRPIKTNFREGLTVLEYFISTHGARKGLADTALRTADSGYLTRRLVDVSQDVIVREEDCGTERGVNTIGRRSRTVRATSSGTSTSRPAPTRAPSPWTPLDADGNVVVTAGTDLGDVAIGDARRGRHRGGQGPLGADLRGRDRHLLAPATAARWPPASSSTSARRSASSPPSPSASPAPS